MHCSVVAMSAARTGQTNIGTNVVFVKFIVRPVAIANLWSMLFSCMDASVEALAMMRVSSAYCKIVGGRCENKGWLRCRRLQSC